MNLLALMIAMGALGAMAYKKNRILGGVVGVLLSIPAQGLVIGFAQGLAGA